MIYLVLISFALLLILNIFNLNFFDISFFKNDIDKGHISQLYDASLIILTILLLFVAWIQLKGIKDIGRADFLLRLDNRFGNKSIIKARYIFHKIYLETKDVDICEDVHIKKIQEKIKEIGQDVNRTKDFAYLLNFLDYLETVAYFSNRGHVMPEDVNNLLGGTIGYYYKVFSAWISYRRNKYKDDCYYRELQNFVEKNHEKKK